MTESLRHAPSDYIDGSFIPLSGDAIVSKNPAQPGQVIWRAAPQPSHVARAVAAALWRGGGSLAWPRFQLRRSSALHGTGRAPSGSVGDLRSVTLSPRARLP